MIHMCKFISDESFGASIWENPIFFFLRQSIVLVAQAGVQWHDLGSLQPLPPGFHQFFCLSLPITGITGVCHHASLIFKCFCRDEVLLCGPGWSWTLGLRQSSCLSFPKCWDYRRESPLPAYITYLQFIVYFTLEGWLHESICLDFFKSLCPQYLKQLPAHT